jgi:hypothetical protein
MNQTLSKFIFGVFKLNLLVGLSISLVLTKLYNKNVAFAFIAGVMITSITFIIKGYTIHTILNFSKSKSVIVAYIGYIFQFIIIIALAFLFIDDYTCLLTYILGTFAQFVGIILYWFMNRKGSD